MGDEFRYNAEKQYVLRRRGVIGDPEVVSLKRGREGGKEGGREGRWGLYIIRRTRSCCDDGEVAGGE